jgi:hypothetical protein
VFQLLLPNQRQGPAMTASELAANVRTEAGRHIIASVIGADRNPSPAQQAIMDAILNPSTTATDVHVAAAARRFAALSAPARHAWLTEHLAGLRAGHITLDQLP